VGFKKTHSKFMVNKKANKEDSYV